MNTRGVEIQIFLFEMRNREQQLGATAVGAEPQVHAMSKAQV